jgi:hypothetical protein
MAAELRDTRSERRQGSSSDISRVREKARIALMFVVSTQVDGRRSEAYLR